MHPSTPQQERHSLLIWLACILAAIRRQDGCDDSGFRSFPRLPASPTVSRQVRERIAQPASSEDRLGGLMGGRVGFAPMAATAALIALVIAGYALFQGNDDNGRLGPTITAGTVVAQNADPDQRCQPGYPDEQQRDHARRRDADRNTGQRAQRPRLG